MFKSISDLKPDPRNPRQISEKSLSGLKYSISEFGDISGITINVDGTIISGHQRITALQDEYGDLEIKDNAISLPNGDIFPIRVVDWEPEKVKAANIAANNQHIAGVWTSGLLPLLEEIKLFDPDSFGELNFSPLKLDLQSLVLGETEKDNSGDSSDEKWVKFEVGSFKGVVHKDVYDLFCSEWDRISGIIESKEITPVIEAIIANSANTPEESLK